MNLVYAAPYVPPAPPNGAFAWQGIRQTWTGWDGSVWDLTDPSGGVALTSDGVEGMGMPEIVNYTHSSPVVHGEAWDGWRADGRKVYWPIVVFSGRASDDFPSSEAWIRRNRAFWRTMRPGKVGTWTVELPTGEQFSLRLRYAGGGNEALERDPARRGWSAYGIELFPEQPFWEAKPVVKQWGAGKQVPFLGPSDAGPPFFVSPSTTLGSATLNNTGDVESFIRWTVIGPTTTVTVGIGGENTVVPFPVPYGKKLIIDTDPRNLIAELDGVDVMGRLTEFNYPALPPGENIKLSLAMEGEGSVEARFTPYMLMGM